MGFDGSMDGFLGHHQPPPPGKFEDVVFLRRCAARVRVLLCLSVWLAGWALFGPQGVLVLSI